MNDVVRTLHRISGLHTNDGDVRVPRRSPRDREGLWTVRKRSHLLVLQLLFLVIGQHEFLSNLLDHLHLLVLGWWHPLVCRPFLFLAISFRCLHLGEIPLL